ncbi:MAG: zinc-binding dehydrogenase [Actinomycetota bacterium]
MRAAVMRGKELVVDEVPDPVPGPGQVLVRTLACGICGSDLHFLKYGDEMVALGEEIGGGLGGPTVDLSRDLIMGHEFSAEVLEVGPDTTTGVNKGDVVVSVPMMLPPNFDMTDLTGIEPIGAYSNTYNGGYAECMLLSSILATKVPNGLDPSLAALTEPMAVGLHAVNKSGIKPGDAAVVLGAGPVGLACISALAQLGVEPIIAADFSAKRRELAATMGAHEVVDPRAEPAIDAWQRVDGVKPLVIYEAVGVPGMLDQAMRASPRNGRVMVVGACMESDTVRPLIGIGKELTISFALGYDPFEFVSMLHTIAEGKVDVTPLITGHVGISGVPGAFEALANPEEHCKILVEPALD